LWLMRGNFNWRFILEMCVSLSSPDGSWKWSRRSTTCLLPLMCCSVQKKRKIYLKTYRLVMKRGCTFMMPELKNQHIVKCLHHPDPKQHAKFDAQVGECWCLWHLLV
jgi:hypothetical protein